jgi:hypothetical protein
MQSTMLKNTLIMISMLPNVIYSVHSLIIPRSQGVRLSREFNARYRDQENTEAIGSLTLTFEKLTSQKSHHLAECLFGSQQLFFSGSAVTNRKSTDLLADYFGLAPDFQGTIFFRPHIKNLVVDLQYSLHLDCFKPGLLLTIDIPLARSRWSLGACVTNEPSSGVFPACYMSTTTTTPTVAGSVTLQQALSGQGTFGDMKRVWNFGKFSFGTLQRVGITNIAFTLTCPVVYYPDIIRFNVLLNTCIPAGNRPDPEFIFSPLVGNGHFGTIGIGFNLTWHAWQITDESTLSFYNESRMSHLFKHTNKRSFDFTNNGPLSRYMLLKQLEFVPDSITVGYAGELINAINFATRRAEVSTPLEGEVLAALIFDNPEWNVSAGYTFYGRTHEHLTIKTHTAPCDIMRKFFGIKGTEGVCMLATSSAVNTTQSNATIFEGGIPDSSPEILSACNLNPYTATVPHQITHTFFAQATYLWPRCHRLNPYLGIGYETEFAASSTPCSLSQWGVWFTGGFSF